jgi:hypothetical protein
MMRYPFRAYRAAIATLVYLWMAVLACLMGCTLPSLANSGPLNVSKTNASSLPANAREQNQADHGQPDLMADMENCPHHSAGNTPAQHPDRKPVRGGGMSCCPVEVTLASKPDIATLQISPAHYFVLQPHFSLAHVRFRDSGEFVPSLWHSGRDTLLETHLLRI